MIDFLFIECILFPVMDHFSRFNEDLKLRAEEAERTLKEKEKVWKVTNKDSMKRVEKLSKEKAERDEAHSLKIEKVIIEVKSSVVEAFWEAKIKLVEDMENAGS